MKIQKTNAARLLDKSKIAYELIPYEVDDSDLAVGHVAEQLGQSLDQVFKTLVLKGDKTGYLVCVIPGDHEVNLKKTAKVSGNKSVEMIPMKDLLSVTGYIRGGCSPIGMKKHFSTFLHITAKDQSFIYISAGVRGLQLKIAPLDILKVTNGNFADLTD